MWTTDRGHSNTGFCFIPYHFSVNKTPRNREALLVLPLEANTVDLSTSCMKCQEVLIK